MTKSTQTLHHEAAVAAAEYVTPPCTDANELYKKKNIRFLLLYGDPRIPTGQTNLLWQIKCLKSCGHTTEQIKEAVDDIVTTAFNEGKTLH